MSVFEDLDREPGQPRLSDLWEWARDDYKAGESADVVCERHRLSRSQFFERAKREGWLRRDQPRRAAEPAYDAEVETALVEHALNQPPTPAYALYRRAWARMERALTAGRRVEAQGYARLARDLRKLALEEERTIYWHEVVRRHETAATPDSPDSVSICGPSGGKGGPAGPAPRAEGGDGDDAGAGSAAASAAPALRDPPRRPVEAKTPDSPDSPVRPSPLNRAERRLAAKLTRAASARGGRASAPVRTGAAVSPGQALRE